jgi:subtilisin family serine protease
MATMPQPGGVRVAFDELQAAESDATVQMDPRLQRAQARHASGRRRRASTSTRGDEIAVIAKVSDLAAWNALSEVRPGVVLGEPADDGSVLTTARIPVQRVEAVRTQRFVISLKAAQPVMRNLKATLKETRSRPADLPPSSGTSGGKGVVVGVIDFGGDFVHRNFRQANGKTRLKALWDQNGPAGVGSGGAPYGRLHKQADIDGALASTAPYQQLGYRVDDEAHGTHVMDIAAGNGLGTGAPGLAPQADLVFVELAASDVPWLGQDVVGSSFGDSVQLLEALEFCFAQAKGRPCVVNMSLGTNGGPHDGTTLVEQAIDRLVRAAPNRAVVIAASNSQADGIHASGMVQPGAPLDLAFRTRAGRGLDDEVELWVPGQAELTAALVAPNGTVVATALPGQTVELLNAQGEVVGQLANRLRDPNNGDNMINVWLERSVQKGRWTLRLSGAQAPAEFHAWIERNDNAQASFVTHRVDTHTLGTLSCGRESIVVGSYDAHKSDCPISWFSSCGPTRDGRQKPEVSAPGHDVEAAGSNTVDDVVNMSGTSMAAPAVAGQVALVLAAAKKKGLRLSSAQLRAAVIGSARLGPPQQAWHPHYGAGRISSRDAVAAVMALQAAAGGGMAAASAAAMAALQAIPGGAPVAAQPGGRERPGNGQGGDPMPAGRR